MNITDRPRTLPRTSLRAPRHRALAAIAATTAIAIAGLAGTRGSIAATGDGAAAPSAPLVAVAPTVSTAGADVAIEPFPGAIEVGRTFGALEQGTLPISPPDRSDTSDDRISHVGLPYRGHVQLLQYRHAPDESPLLIERHYVEQLRAQGFALLTVCEAPCRTASGLEDENAWWARELDPAHQLGTRAFGDRGAYIIGYRRNAIVALRVGTWDLNFGSTIKIIESDSLDLGPIERYAQGQRARTAPAATQPVSTPANAQVVPAAPRRKSARTPATPASSG